MTRFEWGDASVTYPDWVGTAALDERMTGDDAGINHAIGLSDDWLVIGLDIGGGERAHDLKVVAVHKDTPQADGPDGAAANIAAANDGVIPVTEFAVHGFDPYELLKHLTHMFELRLRWKSTENFPIEVRHQDDVNLPE